MRKSRVIFHVLANFIAVADGHKHVSQNQIWFYVGDFANRCFAIAHGNDVNALILQGKPDHLLDVAVVVRNKNFCHRRPSENAGNPPAGSLAHTHSTTLVLEHSENYASTPSSRLCV